MSLKVTTKIHSEARKDFFDAAEYQEEQVVGLGDHFIDEIVKVLEVIDRLPASGTKIRMTERRFLVLRFSYGIIDSVDEDQITIVA